MKKFITVLVFTILSSSCLFAQLGGKYSFQFLELTDNPRQAALGGDVVSIYDYDVNAFQYNPASLNTENDHQLGFNYLPFYAKVKKTSLNYAWNNEKSGMWGLSVNYINYGAIDSYNAQGLDLGLVQSNEYAIGLTKSHVIGPYSMGVTMKLAGSHLAGYTAFATTFDLGTIFTHPRSDFQVGLAAKNIGFVFKDYHSDASSIVPLNVQLGLSYKPEHMPFRVYWNIHHLNNWNIQYVPNENDYLNKPIVQEQEKESVATEIFSHMNFGIEAVFSDNFHIRGGYNHMRRKEMAIDERGWLTGFSIGAMLKIKSIEINYTKAFYHVAGGTNNLGVTLNFNRYLKKESNISIE